MASFGLVEILVILVAVILFLSLIPALLRWLWNITMPDVFGLNQITFWQALRLILIAFLLFGVWMMVVIGS
ncbi:hypothetical protein NC796_26260 [Aliifodinibius sp. S!AR15-10]|nr:hypothetical protein [Aliifodinibius sp. S!AR15-10]MDR8394670.1 hypothetical protein [Aliifodinibius sp. S!AR15-10]